MDDNERNIKLVKDNGAESKNAKKAKNRRNNLRQRVHYQKKQKERRFRKKRQKTVIILAAVIVMTVVLLFLTPIFNIRSISVNGNDVISKEEVTDVLKPLINQNLLRTGERKITKMLKQLHFVDTVQVKKKLFPPSVDITITEYIPVASVRASGKTLILSEDLSVLSEGEDTQGFIVPAVTGVDVKEYTPGEEVQFSKKEKSQILKDALAGVKGTGMLEKIKQIDLTDISRIEMNYEDRIMVKCGTSLDIERKIRLLSQAVINNSLAENARGTIDLSETGKAVYTP